MYSFLKKYRIIIILILLVLFISGCAEMNRNLYDPKEVESVKDLSSFEEVVTKLDTPEKVYEWMRINFSYVPDDSYDDEFRAPQTTFGLRYGDCDDYALFAEYVLKEHGYETEIISVFSATKGHTVCVWKDNNKKYNHLSNSDLRKISVKKLEKIAEDVYADWKVYSIYPSNQGIVRTGAQ
ncbi:transglutaminase-like domain-containing protein [Candidatus Margulisiibacteriota bacterium]